MFLSVLSAGLLGLYDLTKKVAVRDNAVPMVLWLSAVVGATIWAAIFLFQSVTPPSWGVGWLTVDRLEWSDHGLLFGKSVLVGASWTLALFALKHLPLSIAAPIRSTSPIWTLALAVLFLGERPSPRQWLGILIVLSAFWALSVVGRVEGIRFWRDRWVGWMIAATILGAVSSIYDKILLQDYGYGPATVQAWFTFYMVPVMTPLAIWWGRQRRIDPNLRRFEYRRTVLLISPLLLAADMVYFTALSYPDAMVSVVSTLRRCSVVVALVASGFMPGEKNVRKKGVCVAALLCGVVLVLL